MLIDTSKYGVKGFYTYRIENNDGLFRPCATSINYSEAKNKTNLEHKEIISITSAKFPEVYKLFSSKNDKFITPINLHPFLWNNRLEKDVEWYNKINIPFVKFFNYKDNTGIFLPRDISVINGRKENDGLSWIQHEGYSFDKNLEKAKLKSLMELIEKDTITLWWHRETESIKINVKENKELLEIKSKLKNSNIKSNIFLLKNDFNVYVIVAILVQEEYPRVTYGSAAHLDINEAIKHAIYEAISCISAFNYGLINFKKIYPELEYPNFVNDNKYYLNSKYPLIEDISGIFNKFDVYYTYIAVNDGFLVKSYSYNLQPVLYKDTVHLTSRFFLASNTQVKIKNNFPFM